MKYQKRKALLFGVEINLYPKYWVVGSGQDSEHHVDKSSILPRLALPRILR
jgi:hypothetical protein